MINPVFKLQYDMNIEIYQGLDNTLELRVSLDKGTVWLTQKQIAQVFDTQRPAISKHLRNIFNTNELDENSVSSILEHRSVSASLFREGSPG